MSTDLEHLEPGQRVVYHVGKLARARQVGQIAIADIVWQMALRGEVDLCQRRLSDGRFEYIATKRRRTDPHPALPHKTEPTVRRKAA
jgi:hypothetical protein